MKIVLFVGSVRPGRMADRVVALVRNYVAKYGDIEVIIFDPLEKTYLAEVKEPVHFTANPPEYLVADQKAIESADGFIIVCPEYNRLVPPCCAAAISNFPPWSYAARPAVCINYSIGPFGGSLVTQSLQQLCVELSMITMQASVNIPCVDKSVLEDGTLVNPALQGMLRRAFDQFFWYARQMKKALNDPDDPYPVVNKAKVLEEERRAEAEASSKSR